MRLHNDDWLRLAKGTPVNGQRRVRHRNERTEALTVGNLPDRWWAYCQRCRQGAVELKTHVTVGGALPRESTNMAHPTDDRAIHQLLDHERDALALFMARKSMDWMYFGAAHVTWSALRQRLLIQHPSGLMGRDTTERSDQKWLTYDRSPYLAASRTSGNVLLVEDTFSMYKTQFAIDRAGLDAAVVCTLGTRIHDSLFLWLLTNATRVWSFYDGDAAGWKGGFENAKRLQASNLLGGGDIIPTCASDGNDPKDLNLDVLVAHAARLLAT